MADVETSNGRTQSKATPLAHSLNFLRIEMEGLLQFTAKERGGRALERNYKGAQPLRGRIGCYFDESSAFLFQATMTERDSDGLSFLP